MSKHRRYRTESVQSLRLDVLLPLLAAGCIVALDVAKQKFVVALATLGGEVVKLFRFEHPSETRELLAVLAALRTGVAEGQLKVAMEPTGSYGDAVRHQIVSMGVPVWMVSPKHTSDCQELFDRVPSLHDPKSAELVAKLCSLGLASEWKPPSPMRVRLRALVEMRRHEQREEELALSRLEGVLVRHWPEFGQWMDTRKQYSALYVLREYGNPANVASDEQASVEQFLKAVSRSGLSQQSKQGMIHGANTTLGVPMQPEEELLVKMLATRALEARKESKQLEGAMHQLGKDEPVLQRLQNWMGVYTATAVMTLCDPQQYATARQLEKACGLNLREKSSGEHAGRLSITKRGPGVVRQVLYMFALRMIQESDAVRAWYMRRRGYTENSKQRAVIAVMRKLIRATWHVARGQSFDAAKLFDLRRLELGTPTASKPRRIIARRIAPRGIARGTRHRATDEGARTAN